MVYNIKTYQNCKFFLAKLKFLDQLVQCVILVCKPSVGGNIDNHEDLNQIDIILALVVQCLINFSNELNYCNSFELYLTLVVCHLDCLIVKYVLNFQSRII